MSASVAREWVDKNMRWSEKGSFGSLDPTILHDFLSGGPFLRIITDHPLKKLLKLSHPVALLIEDDVDLVVKSPEILESPLHYHPVELVILSGHLEWQLAHHKCKEEHSKGEDIGIGGMIGPICTFMTVVNLGRHISFPCAFMLVEQDNFSISLEMRSKAKITKFDAEFLILKTDEYIFKFDISVCYFLRVQVV